MFMSSYEQTVSSTELPLADLSDRELQQMLAAAVRAYSGRQQQGSRFPAFAADGPEPVVTSTEAVIAAAAILDATNVEIFELGLWRAWGTLA
jgi:hypothetical protein